MTRDEDDNNNHVNYIHFNPVKHGLVTNVKDWELTSFQKFVKIGLFTVDWGSVQDKKLTEMVCGEKTNDAIESDHTIQSTFVSSHSF
ncbi:MAG: hypothetical protein WCG34_05215 [Leptolinea sp.]